MNLREFIDSTRESCVELDVYNELEFIATARTALPLALEMLEIAEQALENTTCEQTENGCIRCNALAAMAKELEEK